MGRLITSSHAELLATRLLSDLDLDLERLKEYRKILVLLEKNPKMITPLLNAITNKILE